MSLATSSGTLLHKSDPESLESTLAVFYFPCRFFGFDADEALTCTGFRDWKHAKGKYGTLSYHDHKCIKRKEAMLSWKEHRLVVAQVASVI